MMFPAFGGCLRLGAWSKLPKHAWNVAEALLALSFSVLYLALQNYCVVIPRKSTRDLLIFDGCYLWLTKVFVYVEDGD
jgi:hypothetical protein